MIFAGYNKLSSHTALGLCICSWWVRTPQMHDSNVLCKAHEQGKCRIQVVLSCPAGEVYGNGQSEDESPDAAPVSSCLPCGA